MNKQTKRQQFIGSWQLDSWTISYAHNEKVTYPFSSAPQGLLVYTDSGWMSAAIGRSDRASFPDQQGLRSLPAEMLAEAYKSYFHYAGPFRIDDDTVIHSVAMSLNPGFVGTEQVRKFRFEANRLILTGNEVVNDQTRFHELQWQRTKPCH